MIHRDPNLRNLAEYNHYRANGARADAAVKKAIRQAVHAMVVAEQTGKRDRP
jgi:hypothetical protein